MYAVHSRWHAFLLAEEKIMTEILPQKNNRLKFLALFFPAYKNHDTSSTLALRPFHIFEKNDPPFQVTINSVVRWGDEERGSASF